MGRFLDESLTCDAQYGRDGKGMEACPLLVLATGQSLRTQRMCSPDGVKVSMISSNVKSLYVVAVSRHPRLSIGKNNQDERPVLEDSSVTELRHVSSSWGELRIVSVPGEESGQIQTLGLACVAGWSYYKEHSCTVL